MSRFIFCVLVSMLLSACTSETEFQTSSGVKTVAPPALRALDDSILSLSVSIEGIAADGSAKTFTGALSSDGSWKVALDVERDIELGKTYAFTANWFAEFQGTPILVLEQQGEFFADATSLTARPNTLDVWNNEPRFDLDCDGYPNLSEMESANPTPISSPGCSIAGVWVGQTTFGDEHSWIDDNSTSHAVMVIDETNYVYSISESASQEFGRYKAEAVFGPVDGALERFWHLPTLKNGAVDSYALFGYNFGAEDRLLNYNLSVSSSQRTIENTSEAGNFTMRSPDDFFSAQDRVEAVSVSSLTGTWVFEFEEWCTDPCPHIFSITINADGSFTGYREYSDTVVDEYSGTVSASSVSNYFLHITYEDEGRARKGVLFQDNKYPGTLTILATGRGATLNTSLSGRMVRR